MISKTLEAWPESPEQLLEDLDRFVHLRDKYADKYQLSLSLYLMPTESVEIEAVTKSEDRLAAASDLLKKKVNRWG